MAPHETRPHSPVDTTEKTLRSMSALERNREFLA